MGKFSRAPKLLRGIMRRAGLWEHIGVDVSQLKERDDCGHALSDDEEKALLAECAASRSRVLHPLVVTLFETGVRYSPIRTLRWGGVDLANGSLKIGKDKTASGRGRTVPLRGRAIETLRFWAEKFPGRTAEHFVFPSETYSTCGAEDTFGFTPEVLVLTSDPSKAVGSIKRAGNTPGSAPACPIFGYMTYDTRQPPG